jgi:hypothetical protein
MNNNNLQINTAIFLATVLVTGVIGISSPFTVFSQEYDGYEYDDYGYDKYMKYDDADQDDSSTTHIIIKNDQQAIIKNGQEASASETKIIKNDQQAIGSGYQPNVQNCAQNNIEALQLSGDEGVDCHNQRDVSIEHSEQSGTDLSSEQSEQSGIE